MKQQLDCAGNVSINLSEFGEKHFAIDEPTLKEYQNSLKIIYGLNDLPCIKVTSQCMDIELMEKIAKKWQSSFDNVIVLGTGGSSLGGQTLYNLLHPGFALPGKRRSKDKVTSPNLYFMDNIDPETFEFLFESFDITRTGFIIISKSGSTIETLAQSLFVINRLKENKLTLSDHIIIITEDKDSPLATICRENKLTSLVHDQKIGGRFSVFSNVAIFPAMIAGIDVRALRDGAYQLFNNIVTDLHHPTLLSAYFIANHIKKNGMDSSVLFTYADSLNKLGQWYRQLVGESLGKNGIGVTPIHSIGTIDQHSQLQLYLDGPRDKFYTMIGYDSREIGQKLTNIISTPSSIDILNGKTLGDILYAEFMATADSLMEKELPTRIITLKKIDEESVGILLMHFMVETIVLSFALQINAFDQPAVERSKILTKEYLCQNK